MTLTISSPGDLVAVVPHLIGFSPDESVVVLGLMPGGALGPVMRADVADCVVRDVVDGVASAMAGALVRAGATRAVVVGFSASSAARAVGAVSVALDARVSVADELVVTSGRYRSLRCDDATCCPPEGTAVPLPPARVRAVLGPVHGMRTCVRAPYPQRRKATRARDRAWAARGPGGAAWRVRRLAEWRDALDAARAGRSLTEAAAGRLAAGLRDVSVRDAAVVDMVPGQAHVADRLCETEEGLGVRESLAAMVTIDDAVAPVTGTIDAVVQVAAQVALWCEDDVAPALTIAGVGQWWAGNERDAARFIATALDAQPDYRLARLIETALEAGMPPGWLARR